MTTLQVLVPLGIAVFSVALNALVNVRLRFAPDRAAGERELRTLALRLGYRVLLTLNVAGFLWNGFRTAPLDRATVFVLVVQGCTLTMTPLIYFLRRLTDLQGHHLAQTGRIIGVLERQQGGSVTQRNPNGPAA